MKKKFKSLRWILLAAGIMAVIGITVMNVYSLFSLRKNSIENARQSKRVQLAEFADHVRHRFFAPFHRKSPSSLDMATLDQVFKRTGQFNAKGKNLMYHVSQDSIFKDIYFIPAGITHCKDQQKLLKFSPSNRRFKPAENDIPLICDAINIARGRMRSIIRDYRYNNKVLFDTPRSMVVALVNQKKQAMVGYLAMPINYDYMITHFLKPALTKNFGPQSHTNLNVWLRNWTDGRILASSNPDAKFETQDIEFRQKFPSFFGDWRLYASINKGAALGNTDSTLYINLILLAAALVFLIGAMLFLFFTAQREEALARRQSDFLANVTHELKTPISVMQAAGENLLDGRIKDSKRLKSYGSHIYRESVRLQRMIDQLLDVAKADAGQSFSHPKQVDLETKIDQFLKQEYYQIKERGFTLDVSLQASHPSVFIDEDNLDTILRNLIDNAIKYSRDEKFLGIYLSRKRDQVILKVVDHGSGMSKKTQKHIFEKFYRAEDTLTAKTNGYGLGLSIVKNLVILNNGSIHVESKPGRGSTFIIVFPIFGKDAQQSPRHSVPSVKQKTPQVT